MSWFDPQPIIMRRNLGDTIAEMAGGVIEAQAVGPARVTGVELRLPVELGFNPGSEELSGDLPRYRRATAFDAPPAQLTIILGEVALSGDMARADAATSGEEPL